MNRIYEITDKHRWYLKNLYIIIKLYEAISSGVKTNIEKKATASEYLLKACKDSKYILSVVEDGFMASYKYPDKHIYTGNPAEWLFNLIEKEREALTLELFGNSRFTVEIVVTNDYIRDYEEDADLYVVCAFYFGEDSEVRYDQIHEYAWFHADDVWEFIDDPEKLIKYLDSSIKKVVVSILRQSITDVNW
jgi:hypothetical protein